VRLSADEKIRREVAALYDVLAEALGTEKVVMRAGKLGTLKEMRSPAIPDRLLALQRIVFEDPSLETRPAKAQYKKIIAEVEDRLADLVAQRTVGDQIEAKINAKMVQRHNEFLRELKLEALREETGPETPATQKRLADLEALDARSRARRSTCCGPSRSTKSSARSPRSKRSSPSSPRRTRST